MNTKDTKGTKGRKQREAEQIRNAVLILCGGLLDRLALLPRFSFVPFVSFVFTPVFRGSKELQSASAHRLSPSIRCTQLISLGSEA